MTGQKSSVGSVVIAEKYTVTFLIGRIHSIASLICLAFMLPVIGFDLKSHRESVKDALLVPTHKTR
jgi:hypothetical protein